MDIESKKGSGISYTSLYLAERYKAELKKRIKEEFEEKKHA